MKTSSRSSVEKIVSEYWLIALIVLIKITLHLLAANNYGYFGDELYTLACSRHLDLGYLDLPPLVPWLLAANTFLIGDSLFAIHILPTLVGAAMIVISALIVKEFGGGKFAQFLTGVTVLFAPVWLTMNTMFAYDTFDQFTTVTFLYVLIRLLKTQEPKMWVWLGVVIGLSLLTKTSMLFFGFALFLSMVLTDNRKWFFTKWPWIACGLAFLIFLPYILWQVFHGWPVVDYWLYYSKAKSYHAPLTEFIKMQLLIIQPFAAPLFIIGLGYIGFSRTMQKYRLIAWMYVILFIMFFFINAKAYMLTSLYVVLFAAGAVLLEKASRNKGRWLLSIYSAVLIAFGVLLVPYSVPILPPEKLVQYFDRLPFLKDSVKLDTQSKNEFPQTIADRFGWDNMVENLSEVYQTLSPDEKSSCRIICWNYGQAGAVDLLGRKFELPKAMSGQLTYYIWGPGSFNGKIALSVGVPKEILDYCFEEVDEKGIIISDYPVPYETNLPIYICRNLKYPIEKVWPVFKNY